MDYNYDFDLEINDEEEDQSFKTKFTMWRKRHPVLSVILIILAISTVVFIFIYLLFFRSSDEVIEDGGNYDVDSASYKIKYGDNTYDAEEEDNSSVGNIAISSEEITDQSYIAEQTPNEESTVTEENNPEFAPWKQYKDTIYSVNSLKDFAKKNGYLDENNHITESGKDILCKKNSVTKGEYYAVSEKGVKEYKEYREEEIKKYKEMLRPKESVPAESAV